MSAGSKVVIAGTGRTGTTLLVQILTDLGLDTGFATDHPIDDRAHAGLESDIESADAPRIVKDPLLSLSLGPLLEAGRVEVEHVIIPIRDLDVAVASRVRIARYGRKFRAKGGLFGTASARRQKEALSLVSYELSWSIARHDLPHTLLAFPRFALDWEYTYRKLAFLDPTIPPERWKDVVTRRAIPALIHELPLARQERVKTLVGSIYQQCLARPVRVTRRIFTGGELRGERRP